MIGRCGNPNHHKYYLYGAKGITVCERWLDFANFYEDMGTRPAGHTIEREDGLKGYEPSNCRWATHTEQNNNRSITRKVCHEGKEATVRDLISKSGSTIDHRVVSKRIFEYGWPVEKALITPLIESEGQKASEVTRSKMRAAKAASANSPRFSVGDEMLTASEIAERYGSTIDTKTIYKRLKRGWPVQEAVFTPVQPTGVYHERRNGPYKHSPEMREKLRQKALERGSSGPMSNEHKAKISASLQGRKHSDEAIEKMRDSKAGISPSEETRQKISQKLKGKPMSEETKRKMREGQQRRRAAEKNSA